MMNSIPPGMLMVVGAFLIPLLKGKLQKGYMLLLPLIGIYQLAGLEHGHFGQVTIFEYTLTLMRVDKLSLVFGYIFHIAAFLGIVYALHVRENLQSMMSVLYAGSGAAALFAGDLISLFIFWELTAISSVFLIWARRSPRSYHAGIRYLIVQVGSGVLLLAGALIQLHQTGSLAFERMELTSLGPLLIFLAFGIKAAFPLLHNWLQDAYPEATVTGTVFLSTFTTKLAIYALARGFPGTEILIWIGAAMTVFPIFYAVIENDLRRVLAYSLNNQLGFMVVGVGIGTEMALNGAAAHAFAHILYKALLFMSMGAVLHRTGTIKASELGGLYKSMPITTVFCLIGAASISAFPLFSGFVSKSMVITALGEHHYTLPWLILMFASAGVLHHSGIKIPFYGFFGMRDSGIRVKEAPLNMLLAMGGTAFLCVAIGVYPKPLYNLLPYPVEFEPYTVAHVVTQLQLLFFALLAAAFLMRRHLETKEIPSTNLDSDWIYRKALPPVLRGIGSAGMALRSAVVARGFALVQYLVVESRHVFGPGGRQSRSWPTGAIALIAAFLLGLYLVLFYL